MVTNIKNAQSTWLPVAIAAGVLTAGGIGAWLVWRNRQNQLIDDEEDLDLPSARDGAGNWVRMRETVRVNAPAEQVYAFWHDYDKLEENMQAIDGIDSAEEVMHWSQKAPLGLWTAEWDAEVVEDKRNRMIAWRSTPASKVPTNGRVRFAPLQDDEDATALTFTAEFQPPGGALGAFFGRAVYPMVRRQVRADLYRVKHALEYGQAVAEAK